MAAAKNIIQLLVLSCLLLFPSVFAFSKESKKVINKISSELGGPFVGLISSSQSVENAFFASNEFTAANSETPYVDLFGRRFHIGTVQGMPVIYVRSGAGLVNAATATQQLLLLLEIVDLGELRGVIHFGLAGNTNDSLGIGDVLISEKFVNTGLWNWLKPNASIPSSDFGELVIKDFNVPKEGSNSLGLIGYSPEKVYSQEGTTNVPQEIVWFNVDSKWLDISHKLESLNLDKCVNGTEPGTSICFDKRPKVVVGLNSTTSNIYVDNEAYRGFLFQKFGVSSVDTASTAVIMTCLANGSPVISFGGLANLAGAEENEGEYDEFKPLVTKNVVLAVVRFVNLLFKNQARKSLIKMFE